MLLSESVRLTVLASVRPVADTRSSCVGGWSWMPAHTGTSKGTTVSPFLWGQKPTAPLYTVHGPVIHVGVCEGSRTPIPIPPPITEPSPLAPDVEHDRPPHLLHYLQVLVPDQGRGGERCEGVSWEYQQEEGGEGRALTGTRRAFLAPSGSWSPKGPRPQGALQPGPASRDAFKQTTTQNKRQTYAHTLLYKRKHAHMKTCAQSTVPLRGPR